MIIHSKSMINNRLHPIKKGGGGRVKNYSSRNEAVDVAKGLGIILVVIGHVTEKGILGSWIYSFHMPLFFLLSGLFFSPKFGKLWTTARKLLIPYFVFAVLSYVYWRFVECKFRPLPEGFDVNMHALDILWQRQAFRFNVPLWFLPCLLMVQCFATVLFAKLNKKAVVAAICFIWLAVLSVWQPDISSMWIKESLCAFPFFGFGYLIGKDGLQIVEEKIKKNHLLWVVAAFALLVVIGFNGVRNDMMMSSYNQGYLVFFLIAMVGCACTYVISHTLKGSKALQWLGVNSLAIMCLHEPLKRIILKITSAVLGMDMTAVRESVLLNIADTLIIIIILIPICKLLNKYCKWVFG